MDKRASSRGTDEESYDINNLQAKGHRKDRSLASSISNNVERFSCVVTSERYRHIQNLLQRYIEHVQLSSIIDFTLSNTGYSALKRVQTNS